MRTFWIVLGLLLGLLVGAACADPPAQNGDPIYSPNGGGQSDSNSSGSSSNKGSNGDTAPSGIPCDVDAILEKNCRDCHGSTPSHGATTSLVTYADVLKAKDTIHQKIHDDKDPMPPSYSLSAQDMTTLDSWIGMGAPASTESCSNNGSGQKTLSCTPDVHIKPAAPFNLPATAGDIYTCYGFDVTPTQKRHVVGFMPHIDNEKYVHHILLFQSDTPVSNKPVVCDGTFTIGWRLTAVWAPGGDPLELPPEAGFPEEANTPTHWVMQIHYSNPMGIAGTDASGYDLCTTDQLRPNDAEVLAFGSIAFAVPPRCAFSLTCDYSAVFDAKPIHIFHMMPHMHKLGKSMTTELLSGGKSTVIMDQPNYNFEKQGGFTTNVTLNQGDALRTRCTWNNTTDALVPWGESTSDEMCFAFASYYPKIPNLGWESPAIASLCTPN
jgi:hypothetical protein